jgi:Na+-driven multidrug efflux pump
MMVFISIYYAFDSILEANLVGAEALAALAVSYPIQGIMWGLCIMLASGASAIVAIKMGEGKQQEANEKYTSICVLSIVMGCILTAAVLIFMDPIVDFLGATENLRANCRIFLELYAWGFPAAFIGVVFEYFIRVDGSPGFTLFLYIVGGIVHVGTGAILMGPCDMGIAGTGYANVAGLLATALTGAAYFVFADTKLKISRFRPDWKFIGHCYVNGSSELVSESSAGITTFFFNMLVIGMVGEVGPAAISIVLNLHYIVISVYLGYIMGIAPLISYFYGAKKYDKVNLVINKKLTRGLK